MAIKQSVLLSKSQSYSKPLFESIEKTAKEKNLKTAFLCHSHKDEYLVKGLIVIFQEAGLDLFVDWKDHTMPATPNGLTAKKIKNKIINTNIFLFLATSNSKASRWCPWEIGFADSCSKGIYIIPTSDNYDTYGNEYLELYPKIDQGIYRFNNQPGYFETKPQEKTGYAISNYNLK